MGKPTVWAFGLGIGAIVILASEHTTPPAAAPAPATRTIVVHQTVTRIVQVAGHTGLPPWAIVVIAFLAFGALCGMTLGRRTS